jgi:hypothetical protein
MDFYPVLSLARAAHFAMTRMRLHVTFGPTNPAKCHLARSTDALTALRQTADMNAHELLASYSECLLNAFRSTTEIDPSPLLDGDTSPDRIQRFWAS